MWFVTDVVRNGCGLQRMDLGSGWGSQRMWFVTDVVCNGCGLQRMDLGSGWGAGGKKGYLCFPFIFHYNPRRDDPTGRLYQCDI